VLFKVFIKILVLTVIRNTLWNLVKLISVMLFIIQTVWKQLMGTYKSRLHLVLIPSTFLPGLLISLYFSVKLKAKKPLKNHERREMYKVHSLKSSLHLCDNKANQSLSNCRNSVGAVCAHAVMWLWGIFRSIIGKC